MNCACGQPATCKDGSGQMCDRCAKLESERRQREAVFKWKKQQAVRAAEGMKKYEGRGSASKLYDEKREGPPGWAWPAFIASHPELS